MTMGVQPRAEHGTNGGYIAHFVGSYADRQSCTPCKAAHALYQRTLWRRRYIEGHKTLLVPAVGIKRRGQALNFMGWTLEQWAREAGYEGKNATNYVYNCYKQQKITVYKHAALSGAYERMCMTLGPSLHARKTAMYRRYPGPLCWDDIDDPDEEPMGIKGIGVANRKRYHYVTGEVK